MEQGADLPFWEASDHQGGIYETAIGIFCAFMFVM